MISHDPKFREPQVNWYHNFKIIIDAVGYYARARINSEKDHEQEFDSLSDFAKAVKPLVQRHITS